MGHGDIARTAAQEVRPRLQNLLPPFARVCVTVYYFQLTYDTPLGKPARKRLPSRHS